MSLKRIAVHLDQGKDCMRRMAVAMQLAKVHDAHVTGIYASYPDPQYFYDDSVLTEGAIEVFRTTQTKARIKVEKSFKHLGQTHAVSVSTRHGTGDTADVVATHARSNDLLILGQQNDADTASISGGRFIEQLLLTAGRPILVIPSAGTFPAIGERVLCCWNHSREASRALADAAPFLDKANHLTVLTMNTKPADGQMENMLMDDLAAYCFAHDYPIVEEITRDTQGSTAGEMILAVASDCDSDLIVMGAYGHSRIRQWIMGGATAYLLREMTLPVLFSH
ncbi:MAG: universal stress protein [Burkholderiaceae bacterium]